MLTLWPLDETPRPGQVSPVCRYQDNDGVRFVLIHEQVVYCYDRADRTAERSVWVQVHRAGHATQGQIAQGLGVGLRTVNGWVHRYRQEGVAGLIDKPKSGRPPKADAAKVALVHRYRQAGKKITEIVVLTNLSRATVNRILGRDQVHPELALESAEPASSPSVPASPEVVPPVYRPEPGLPSTVAAEPAATAAEPPTPSLASSTPGVNPLDRSEDRLWARLGLLDEAAPVFAPGENLPWAGAFLALALLNGDVLLPVAQKVFGLWGSAFYGLRTCLVSLVLMALLRIKRPEGLRGQDAVALGRVLGLDRGPEVKTLRRKLHQLSQPGQGVAFMEALGQARCQELNQAPSVVYIDGHISVYSGQAKIGQVYAPSHKSVVKGTTQTWVNLPGPHPVFCVSSEFNEGLSAALPGVIEKIQQVLGVKHLTLSFDRGGQNGGVFERLIQQGHHLITYRRGASADWPLEGFEKVRTPIGQRLYEYAPAEQPYLMPVYEERPAATGQRGAPRRQDTGRRVNLREIRVVRPQQGQTSVLASSPEASAVEICAVIFGRWGAQENIFKYLLAEFDLDATVEYGDEALSARIEHPNPEYVRRQKTVAKLVNQRDRRLGQLGLKLTQEPQEPDQLNQLLAQWAKRAPGKKVQQIQAQIQQLRAELATIPARIPAEKDGYRRLKTEMKLVTTAIKLSAYHLETKLVDLVAPFYANHAKEGRKLIVAALRSSGSIRLQPGQIRVRLSRQSAPCRTRAIGKLCEQLNQLKPLYPGTDLQIVFDPPED